MSTGFRIGRPLVGRGPELTAAERLRYARQITLPDIGERGQRRLKNARVLLIGAGGLGSPALIYLAAAGVGQIGVVDDDLVDESNLHRQIAHRTADVGRPKVDSAVDAAARANPLISVRTHRFRLTDENAAGLFAQYDLVVDGSDNFTTRYVVNDGCVAAGVPWVWGAVQGFEGQIATFHPGYGPTFRDVFAQAAEGDAPSCVEAGVLGSVCAMVASAMATEAVKLLTGAGRPLIGRLTVLDGLAMRWRTLNVGHLPPEPDLRVREIEPDAARKITGAVWLDVREPSEYVAAQPLPQALCIPLDDVLENPGAVPGDGEVIVYCASGVRSRKAAEELLRAGRAAHSLRGGLAAWH